MPLYDMECERCGPVMDVWARIDEEVMTCPKCSGIMRRVLSATRSNPDYQPYVDDNLVPMGATQGTVIKSRQHRAEMMRRLDVVDKWSGC